MRMTTWFCKALFLLSLFYYNSLFYSNELNRQLQMYGVTSNSCHPGNLIYTSLPNSSLLLKGLFFFARPFTKSLVRWCISFHQIISIYIIAELSEKTAVIKKSVWSHMFTRKCMVYGSKLIVYSVLDVVLNKNTKRRMFIMVSEKMGFKVFVGGGYKRASYK